jgi:hypothetical protein
MEDTHILNTRPHPPHPRTLHTPNHVTHRDFQHQQSTPLQEPFFFLIFSLMFSLAFLMVHPQKCTPAVTKTCVCVLISLSRSLRRSVSDGSPLPYQRLHVLRSALPVSLPPPPPPALSLSLSLYVCLSVCLCLTLSECVPVPVCRCLHV